MRLLITGGTGFIGTNFINRCIKEGFQVLVYCSDDPLLAKVAF